MGVLSFRFVWPHVRREFELGYNIEKRASEIKFEVCGERGVGGHMSDVESETLGIKCDPATPMHIVLPQTAPDYAVLN